MASKTKKMVKVSSSSASSEPNEEDLRAIIAKLRSELDTERKTIRQLRREKAIEVQQAHEQEQAKAWIGMRDLSAKLHEEKQREVELQKEALRSRLEADSGKVIKLKDQEVKKLKQDLARCQEELKEEVTKRGLSTSARGTFEKERNKLLQEVKELSVAKKQLESALAAAADAEKRRNQEFRQLQDSCKLELARVEKEANVEVKKLLEELKSKDNMLAMMDRNLYPDRTSMLKQRVENLSIQELLNLSREVEKMSNIPDESKPAAEPCVVSGGCALQTIALQKKLYELEKQVKFANSLHQAMVVKNNALTGCNLELEGKVKLLTGQLNNLNWELSTNKAEIGRLNDAVMAASTQGCSNELSTTQTELETYKQQYADLQQILSSVRLESQDKDRRIALLIKSQEKQKRKRPPKSVRFLLPALDEGGGENSLSEEVDTETKSSPMAFSDANVKQDRHSDEMLIQSLHRDYEKLMEEHLQLEKHCAALTQSLPDARHLEQQSWMLEKESLQVAFWTLEDKLHKAEKNEQITRCQLEEAHDQNEELEFRILELEESTERNMSTFYNKEDVEMMEKNKRLEIQVLLLMKRLSQYEIIDINELEKSITLHDVNRHQTQEFTESFGEPHQRLSRENLRKLTASLSDSDDDNPMVQSFSTMTSGFDEISCISLDLDKIEIDTIETVNADVQICTYRNSSNEEVLSKEACGVEADATRLASDVAECEEVALSGSSNIDSSDVDSQDLSFRDTSQNQATEAEQHKVHDIWLEDKCSFSRNELPVSDQSAQVNSEEMRRIQKLQDEVEVLEQNDIRFSKTIKALDEIEQELASVFDDSGQLSQEIAENSAAEQENVETQFLIACQRQIDADIGVLEQIISQVANHHQMDEISTLESDTHCFLEKCVAKLKEVKMSIVAEERVTMELCEKIRQIENQTLAEIENKSLIAQFSFKLAEQKLRSLDFCRVSYSEASSSHRVKSLKRYALEAVASEMKDDFEEMRNIAAEFSQVSDVDDSSSRSTPEKPNEQCQNEEKRVEKEHVLMINTELLLPCTRESLGFLSPSCLEPEWPIGGHHELVNYSLQQQIKDLEAERDALKELFYRDAHIVNEHKIHIYELEASSKSLQEDNKKLQLAEQVALTDIEDLNKQCAELKLALKKFESNETSLKLQIEACETSEFALKMKIQNVLAAQEKNESRLKARITELKKDKLNIEHRAEEMSNLVERLEAKERSLRQRGKSLESNRASSQEKLNELESALGLAYDEVNRVNQQKDRLSQKVGYLEDQNSDLKREISESKEELARVVAENNKLVETESFLKEANQKMWLSLHANLKGCTSDPGSLNVVNVDEELMSSQSINNDLQNMDLNEGIKQNSSQSTKQTYQFLDKSVQVRPSGETSGETGCTVGSKKCIKVVIPNSNKGLRQAIQLLGSKYPCVQAEFIATAIKASAVDKVSQSSETAMQKFVTSLQFRCSDPSNVGASGSQQHGVNEHSTVGKRDHSQESHDESLDTTLVEEGGGDQDQAEALLWKPAKGEETFWAMVEDTNDIYDVRAADRSSFWVDLENIMGVNYDGMEMILEFSDPIPTDAPSSLPTKPANRTSPQTFTFPTKPMKTGSEAPPVPTRSPPPESDSSDVAIQQSLGVAAPGQGAESADEASEIRDEDDGAARSAHSRAAAFSAKQPRGAAMTSSVEERRGTRRGMFASGGSSSQRVGPTGSTAVDGEGLLVGVSMESVGDSGMESAKWKQDRQSVKENEATQTEMESLLTISRNEQSTSLLRMQLEQKDKNLLAKIHEVDRVTQEMRRWQQKAVEAAEEAASVSAALEAAKVELSAMRGETLSGRDSRDGSGKLPKKARLEPYVSQIPVSAARHATGPSSASLLTSQANVTSQAHGPLTSSQTRQESVHTAGSSLSRPLSFKSTTSHIPRPIGEKYQTMRSTNGTTEKKFETSTQAAAHGTSPVAAAATAAAAAADAAETEAAYSAETAAAAEAAAVERAAEVSAAAAETPAAAEAADRVAKVSAAAEAAESTAASEQQQLKPSTEEGEPDV